MILNDFQKAMLDGEFGEGAAYAMKIQVGIGECFDAARMVPIKDAILDTETLAGLLCERLLNTAPDKFCARYKLDAAKLCELKPHELLAAVAKKRGFLISGGELDTERAAAIVLDEFRSAKIGNISLETP